MVRGMKRTLPKQAPKQSIETLNAQFNASIHNRFDIEVIDACTGEIKQKAYAENIILNQLWTRMFNAMAANRIWNNQIHWGTGTATPVATDTGLTTFGGYITPVVDGVPKYDPVTGIYAVKKKAVMTETVGVGSTISEVGIGYGTTAATGCTKALLKDMNGNTISILKTSTDIINIYATVYFHIPEAYRAFIKFDTKNYFLKWATGTGDTPFYGSYDIGLRISNLTGMGVALTLDAATKKLTATFGRLAAANGNGIGGLYGLTYYSSYYAESYNPTIKLDPSWYVPAQITGEAIGTGDGTTVDFKTAFGEIQSATVYVNGVADNTVTVDFNRPWNYTNFAANLITIDEAGNEIAAMLPGVTGTHIWYNPYYESIGLESISFTYGDRGPQNCFASNDLVNWVNFQTSALLVMSVPTAYRRYKYFKLIGTGTANYMTASASDLTAAQQKNVHFATPPASGAVITIDYTPNVIAKDANHVFDLTMTFTFGEKTT